MVESGEGRCGLLCGDQLSLCPGRATVNIGNKVYRMNRIPSDRRECVKNLYIRRNLFMSQKLGKASIRPEQPVYILNSGAAGPIR